MSDSSSSHQSKLPVPLPALKLIAVVTIIVNACLAVLYVLKVITPETFNQLFLNVLYLAGIIIAACIAVSWLTRPK